MRVACISTLNSTCSFAVEPQTSTYTASPGLQHQPDPLARPVHPLTRDANDLRTGAAYAPESDVRQTVRLVGHSKTCNYASWR